jgi:hypothetical protein
MATTYTSTLHVSVWKEHTCAACGARFRYLFQRKKAGQGNTPEAAEAAARNAVVQALEHEVDMHPCPACGRYQPDMIAVRRRRWHWYLFWIALPVLVLLVILGGAHAIPYALAGYLAAGWCAGLLLVHLIIDAINPNRDLERNQRLAADRVDRGDMWVPDEQPSEQGEDVGSGWTSGHAICYLFLLAGVLALLAPDLLRIASGWTINANSVYPEVAGPGDEVKIWFPDRVSSVKGLWNGTATVEVANAAEVSLAGGNLKATTNNATWSQTIRVKSSEKNSSSRLWVRVQLPPQADLAGKTLQLRMRLNVNYPAMAGGNRWNPAQGAFTHNTAVKLSAPNSGSQYTTWWWAGMLGGSLLVLVPSALLAVLAGAFRRKALPTQVIVPDSKDEDAEDADADAEARRKREEEERDRDRNRGDHFRE